jgi:hypothetical protein
MSEDFLASVSTKSRPQFYFEKERPSFHTAGVIFGNDDAHPPSVGLSSRAEEPASEVLPQQGTTLRLRLAAWGSDRDVGARERTRGPLPHCILYALQGPADPSGPKGPSKNRPPGPAGSKGRVGMQWGEGERIL